MLTSRQRWSVLTIAAELFLDLLALLIIALSLNVVTTTYGLVIVIGLSAAWTIAVIVYLMRVPVQNPNANPPVVGPSARTIKTGLFVAVINVLLNAVALALLLIPMGIVSKSIMTWVAIVVLITLAWDIVMAIVILR